MELFSDEDIQIERVWCGESIGTKLVIQHSASGITAERVIGFDDESLHKQELVAELKQRFFTQFPNRAFIMEHLWRGPGKGAALWLHHTPSGIKVGRVIGYDPVARHPSGMMAEMMGRLREHETDRTE
ncbi:MAG: hypothetical protein EOP83_25195 [Verrucomicrobiaceae bacterium]|nr:MAG: hypothetical protein EOP83_25195 [Verrucomicrobiaceae bacterium]